MKIKKLIGLLAVMCSILLTSCGVGPVVKELKKINDPDSRYWAEFVKKNGINAIDYEEDTVLQYALENYNPSLIKACVKCGANVNLTTKNAPLLYYPVAHKDIDLVKLFLSKGAIVIGETPYQDTLLYSCAAYTSSNPFDDNAKNIYELLFSKISIEDINRIADYIGEGYFANITSGNKNAIEYILDSSISKGYKLTEKDIYTLFFILPSDKATKIIIDNLDNVALYWVFEVIAKFDPYAEADTNENRYQVFKTILNSIEINDSNFNDIDKTFGYLFNLGIVADGGYYKNINNLPEKIKEIVSILKKKNFDIQSSEIIWNPGWELNEKLKSVKNAEEQIEYWTNSNYPDNVASWQKDLSETVTEIKNMQAFENTKYLLSEGFRMNEESKELFDYFVNNYCK